MIAFLCLFIGFGLGYLLRGKPVVNHSIQKEYKYSQPRTQQQRLYLKSMHQSNSDRIRELNQLSANQSVFLRLLKQTFSEYEIAIKQQRFIVLDRDALPIAIFEYRDGIQARKLIDHEDGIPLHLYKALISSEALKQDYLNIKAVSH